MESLRIILEIVKPHLSDFTVSLVQITDKNNLFLDNFKKRIPNNTPRGCSSFNISIKYNKKINKTMICPQLNR